MISRITPAALFVHAIHAPARGNVDSVPENSPTTTSSAVMPSEKTNRYVKPNTPLRVVATQVNTAAKTGAPHGAATIPDVAPRRKTAGYDPPESPPPPPPHQGRGAQKELTTRRNPRNTNQ